MQVLPSAACHKLAIADGGDGTLISIHQAIGGQLLTLPVAGPTGKTVSAQWLRLRQETASTSLSESEIDAVVELASASGIAYLENQSLDPLNANTCGTGELLAHCLKIGLKKLILTVGGSASTDGGSGILTALGARLLDRHDKELAPCGKNLLEIARIDLSPLGFEPGFQYEIKIATDVDNPLLGPQGAARIFAPQKGAGKDDVERLESGLAHFADLLESATGVKARDLPGSGAAGGVPFGLTCALNASIVPGYSFLSRLVGLEDELAKADLVITAEGQLDSQSLSGKAVGGLAAACQSRSIPLIVIPARASFDFELSQLKNYGISLVEASALANAPASLEDVERAAMRVCRKALREGLI